MTTTTTIFPINSGHPAPLSGTVSWDVTPLGTGYSLMKFVGDLKPGWLGRLSSYLSHERINIVHGRGVKSSPLCWEAAFEIEGHHTSTSGASGLSPVAALAGAAKLVQLPSLSISDFIVERSTRHGGCLYVEISGKDCLGFLYGVLRTFSFYSLFPSEFEISTSGFTALDRFWVKGVGGSTPTPEEAASLHDRLDRMLGGRV